MDNRIRWVLRGGTLLLLLTILFPPAQKTTNIFDGDSFQRQYLESPVFRFILSDNESTVSRLELNNYRQEVRMRAVVTYKIMPLRLVVHLVIVIVLTILGVLFKSASWRSLRISKSP